MSLTNYLNQALAAILNVCTVCRKASPTTRHFIIVICEHYNSSKYKPVQVDQLIL